MDKTDKVTATDNAGQDQGNADPRPADESYTKHRIKRAIEKQSPILQAQGRKSLLEELGLDADDETAIDTLKATLAKGASADSELTKLQKQLAKERAEREVVVAQAAKLERSIAARAVHDTIAEAIGDARIVPGTLHEIQTLLSGRFTVADGKVAVLGEDGEPANMAPKKLISDWLSTHTHYLAATAPQGGAGSRPANGDSKAGKKAPATEDELRAKYEALLRGES